jgi:hypothetical protein
MLSDWYAILADMGQADFKVVSVGLFGRFKKNSKSSLTMSRCVSVVVVTRKKRPMMRLRRFSGSAMYWLSVGGAVLSMVAAGQAAPSATAEPDWPALLQKLQSLDTAKPEAVATLRDVLAEMIRGQQTAARESELRKELEAKSKEIEALRAELQALRAPVPAPSATRAYRASTRSKPAAGMAAAPPIAGAAAPPGAPQAATPAPPGSSRPATASAAAPTVLFGKKGLKKVHRADCQFGSRITETDRIYFKNMQEATAAGYEACKVCKPGG